MLNKLKETDSVKRLQCCLDSEGYAVVLKQTVECEYNTKKIQNQKII